MQFKTAAEIRAQRDAAGKNAEREAREKQKQAERAQQKYDRMAEESARREAEAAKKPKLVVRPGVIEAPALKELKEAPKFAKPGPDAKLVITPPTKPLPPQPHRQGIPIGELKLPHDKQSEGKASLKVTVPKVPTQRWDADLKQWVKL